jgi:hypothetical protein
VVAVLLDRLSEPPPLRFLRLLAKLLLQRTVGHGQTLRRERRELVSGEPDKAMRIYMSAASYTASADVRAA